MSGIKPEVIKLITHREDFFLSLGFGMSGVHGMALSPIHCSRGESVPFRFTSCLKHKQKVNKFTSKYKVKSKSLNTLHRAESQYLHYDKEPISPVTFGYADSECLMLVEVKLLTFGAIRLTISDISTTLCFLSPDPGDRCKQILKCGIHVTSLFIFISYAWLFISLPYI